MQALDAILSLLCCAARSVSCVDEDLLRIFYFVAAAFMLHYVQALVEPVTVTSANAPSCRPASSRATLLSGPRKRRFRGLSFTPRQRLSCMLGGVRRSMMPAECGTMCVDASDHAFGTSMTRTSAALVALISILFVPVIASASRSLSALPPASTMPLMTKMNALCSGS